MELRDKLRGQRALLRFLQRQERISGADAVRFEQQAANANVSVQEVLEREGVITEKDLAILLAESLRLPLVNLASIALDPQVVRALKEPIATKHEVVPVRFEEGSIHVATANPLDLDALKAVEFTTGRRAHAMVATRVEVSDALAHAYRLEESLEQFLQNVPAGELLTVAEIQDDLNDSVALVRDAELQPVVKLADRILIDGIRAGASDIHIEPSSADVAVRCRIDGMLEESFRFPKWIQNPLVARFKVMAKLDITERRVPQDGRIQVHYGKRLIDLRASSMPTQHGEKIVLRILDAARALNALGDLGFSEADLRRVREAAAHPEGMILVTGPTGSGKTTTLYALLREIQSPSVNIVTIENPIEYQIPGINQVEINEKQGLTFASVLRSTLRQDPDVILVGEIRDHETAEIAFQAAQTGHLVLSTLHTNDAAATVTRLLDLEIEPYVVASSVNVIIAQRLVRRVCASCSAPYSPPDESRRLLRLDQYRREFRRGKGCPECRQTGYVGRTGVYEIMPMSPSIVQLTEGRAGETALRQQARSEGLTTLLEDALAKLSAGKTTAEEVLRVVQVGEAAPHCPGCQEEIDEHFAVCPYCGTALRVICGGCGKPLRTEWLTCPYCGGRRAGTAEGRGESAETPQAAAGALSPAVSDRRRTFKALVVDDDPDLRRIVRMTLERSGLSLTVVTAQDGEEALTLASVERPDVVILDVCMPGIDGYEVCRRLRANIRTAFVPVLMLTARDEAQSVAQGFQAGTDDYVTKPFRRDELVARVQRMMQRTYGSAALSRTPPEDAAAPAAEDAAPRSSGTAG